MIPDSIKTFPNKIIKLSYFKSLLTSFIQSNPKVKNGLIHVRKENSKILNTPDKIENMIQFYNECVKYLEKENYKDNTNDVFIGILRQKHFHYSKDDDFICYGIFLIQSDRIYYNYYDIIIGEFNKVEIKDFGEKWQVFDLLKHYQLEKEFEYA